MTEQTTSDRMTNQLASGQQALADGAEDVSLAGGRIRRKRRPRKLFRIGEVVEYSDVSRQTIHNYTTMGLIEICDWTRGGHRLYDEQVFERLDRIEELKAQKRSLGFIRDFFSSLREVSSGSPGEASRAGVTG